MKTAIAVIVGFVVWTVIWLSGGFALHVVLADALPTEGNITSGTALALVLVLSIVCSLAAGLVAAKLDRTATMRSLLILGVLLLAVGIVVQASSWSRMPMWYHLSFLALLIPMTIAGGTALKRP